MDNLKARKELDDELAAQGLPATATLAELIAHHRANAALAATFDGISEGRRQARKEALEEARKFLGNVMVAPVEFEGIIRAQRELRALAEGADDA